MEEIILRETKVFRIVVEGMGGNFGFGGRRGGSGLAARFCEEGEGPGVEEMSWRYPGFCGPSDASLEEMA